MEAEEEKKCSFGGQCLSVNDIRSETIVVTHVENPEKFYCRLASDEGKFQELNEKIWSRVRSPFVTTPDYESIKKDDQILAYSSINKKWCRSQVYSIDRNKDIINVKVYLIDFGSIEIIALNQLRDTEEEIVNFNSRQSFCFECSLCYIKPFNESNEWSSYANYLFEKLTKDKLITLKYQNYCDGVIICDLSSCNVGSAINESFVSLIEYLVHTRVARYKMGQHFYHRLFKEDGQDLNHNSNSHESEHFDGELNLIEYNTSNRLLY